MQNDWLLVKQNVKPVGSLNSANPLAVFPNGLDGGQVARIKDIFRSGENFPFF